MRHRIPTISTFLIWGPLIRQIHLGFGHLLVPQEFNVAENIWKLTPMSQENASLKRDRPPQLPPFFQLEATDFLRRSGFKLPEIPPVANPHFSWVSWTVCFGEQYRASENIGL